MNNVVVKISVFVFLTALSISVSADPGDPGNLGPTPTPQPVGVPVDGGASLLAAGGIGYALKKYKAAKKVKATDSETGI